MANYSKHSAEATARLFAPAQYLKIGDFVWMKFAYGKENDLADFVKWAQHSGTSTRLCKVIEIVDAPNDFDLTRNWMGNDFAHLITSKGGCESDDAPQKQWWEYTPEERKTFYNVVAILRTPGGKYIAVDKEGYDYCRMVGLPANYGEIFAAEVDQAEVEIAEEITAKNKAERKEREERIAAIKAKKAELLAKYADFQKADLCNANYGQVVESNLKKWLKINFPAVKCEVEMREWKEDSYCLEADIKVYGSEEVAAIMRQTFRREWKMRMTNENGESEYVFANIFGFVNFDYFHAI